MRMSRVKRRRLGLQQRRARMHCRKKAAAALLTGLTASVPFKTDAVTPAVLQDISRDVDDVKNHLVHIRDLDLAGLYTGGAAQNVSLAQHYLEEAEGLCNDAADNLRMAEENLQQAEEQAAAVEAELAEARADRLQLTEGAAARQQAVADYLPVWSAARAELQQRLEVQQAAVLERPGEADGSAAGVMSYQEQQRSQWLASAWQEAGVENNPGSESDTGTQPAGLDGNGKMHITGGKRPLKIYSWRRTGTAWRSWRPGQRRHRHILPA